MMKKIFFIFIILLAFTNCAGLYKIETYKIKFVDNKYDYERNHNILFLTEPIGKSKNNYNLGRIYLEIEIPNYDIPNYIYNDLLVIVKSSKENYFLNGKIIVSEKEKYNKPEILNDVIITKKDGEKIIVDKNKIRYTYKENPDTDFKEARIHLPEVLSGPIILELGKVKIGDEIYNVPKIYMQKYRVTESYSLVGAMLEEGGEHLPGYHSEKWIDE